MANLITLGMLNVNVVMQNAGVFLGQVNVTGWDAHSKSNVAQGSLFGRFNSTDWNHNNTFDGFEVIDGVIMDQDIKTQTAVTF